MPAMTGVHCPKCGVLLPDKQLAATCGNCLNKAYLAELAKIERERLHALGASLHIGACLYTGQERRGHAHILFAGDQRYTYCGMRISVFKRDQVREMPPGICELCRRVAADLLSKESGE